jgi:beta-galactosidase
MTAMNYARAHMPLPSTVDLVSVNYQGAGIRSNPGRFPEFRARFPDKMIFSSESASALSSRGEYQFPVTGALTAPVRPDAGGDWTTHQVSAYELYASDFGTSADRAWAAQDQYPYVAGEFVWSGWDYLGEPTPFYDARSSYSGIIDLAGFRKDRFYLYQARWRPDLPLAHILPHWTWPGREGKFTPVHVFTSGDEAELFINGKSQGRKKRAEYEYRLRWDLVKYEPGEVRVVAYRQGRQWATSSVRTTGDATGLALAPDRSRIAADGADLSFVTLRVTDKHGNTDNGDPTSIVPFPSPERPALNGLCLAIVRSRPGRKGTITVRAESPALQGVNVTLQAH